MKSNVPIKHNANFLLSHVFVSLVLRADMIEIASTLFSECLDHSACL